MARILILFLTAITLSLFSFAQSSPPAEQEDQERILDDVEIKDKKLKGFKSQPTTGTLKLDARPIRPKGAPAIFSHVDVELFIRPITVAEGGYYIADRNSNRPFAKVDVELGIGKTSLGSRKSLAYDGERTLELPGGLYVISEVRYEVFSQLGRNLAGTNDVTDPAGGIIFPPNFQTHRFCMSDRAFAFEITNGQTTDLGLLLIRALERNYRRAKTEHRPIFAASVPIKNVWSNEFRNQTEDQPLAAAILLEKEDEDLCGSTAKHVAGWFNPEEFSEAFPKVSRSK